ncbi:hypothetical protein BB561_002469 [Smittium simulii]|uniref:Uncharacterized protein n=1 Tax=Smittium simulii TaxID=133385 RepID=A0A2T9YQD5_9FUNG|nr:hypothetical protein BB561_002469 [Smittium simulii]
MYKEGSDYFVGYVEDDESVEAIMKKFQELENIQKEFLNKAQENDGSDLLAKNHKSENSSNSILKVESEHSISSEIENKKPDSASGVSYPSDANDNFEVKGYQKTLSNRSLHNYDAQLPDHLLAEVFKRTSAFTVKGALMDQDELDFLDDVDLWKTEKDEFSDGYQEEDEYLDADDDYWDEEFGFSYSGKFKNKRKSNRSFSTRSSKLGLRDQIIQRYKFMQVQIKDKSGHIFLIKRKVNTINPLIPTYTRIPPYPISYSWAKNITPLSNKPIVNNSLRSVNSIIDLNWCDFSNYQAVYMTPSLSLHQSQDLELVSILDLEKIPAFFLFGAKRN